MPDRTTGVIGGPDSQLGTVVLGSGASEEQTLIDSTIRLVNVRLRSASLSAGVKSSRLNAPALRTSTMTGTKLTT